MMMNQAPSPVVAESALRILENAAPNCRDVAQKISMMALIDKWKAVIEAAAARSAA